MKLQFRHQQFQTDAATAVCDVFAGQPHQTPTYRIDPGNADQTSFAENAFFTGFGNASIKLDEATILAQIRTLQQESHIRPSDKLEGRYNLTIEMETGVGKTYTYIKTIYELNRRYGWSKFIVVVPSVAIREGVYKSFQMTEEHFVEGYRKKIRYFIYNSAQLTDIDRFASDSSINVMIINSQAFNAKGKDARRIRMRLDEFRSRKPIDIIAATNPILIIDEPQSVEGDKTRDALREFHPLFTLRYSATHRKDRLFNLVYRLDALEAYNQRLVKRIAVKGITESGSMATEGYVYVQSINISKGKPTATVEFEIRGQSGVRRIIRTITEGFNLWDNSNELEQYRHGFIVSGIDGRDSSVTFLNGLTLHPGEVHGTRNEEGLRRIQIRETIVSHLEREMQLYAKGIKVLSLFFIDEVALYRKYGASGSEEGGVYARIFEEEYLAAMERLKRNTENAEVHSAYLQYLSDIDVSATHAGYFSIDRKSGRMTDSKYSDRKERTSDDIDAYDLIMKAKERLLGFSEPVRFIFSHSALREGWDNPNVFQICTLKSSGSEVRKRQEVGRGLRLAVNQEGIRMDENQLGRDEVHNINTLTIIANESYESFAKGLQQELAEAVSGRPSKVTAELFVGQFGSLAVAIHEALIKNDYVQDGQLTALFHEDKQSGVLRLPKNLAEHSAEIIQLMDSVYDASLMQPENALAKNVHASLDMGKLNSQAFQQLWAQIRGKSYYTVQFDDDELIRKAIAALDAKLRVPLVHFKIERGMQTETIQSREQLQVGAGFEQTETIREDSIAYSADSSYASLRYDLVGKIVHGTGLTRKTVTAILRGIAPATFGEYRKNPEEFIIRASKIIKDEAATIIVERIRYDKVTATYDTTIFTEPGLLRGVLGKNAWETQRHLYDYLITDSGKERAFASALDAHTREVEVYVKLPRGFYIDTPMGKYNPDWAIVFYEGAVKNIYFIAETKGTMETLQLRSIESAKIRCARAHFRAISGDEVKYDVVDSYDALRAILQH